jgi:hypothetical protein
MGLFLLQHPTKYTRLERPDNYREGHRFDSDILHSKIILQRSSPSNGTFFIAASYKIYPAGVSR